MTIEFLAFVRGWEPVAWRFVFCLNNWNDETNWQCFDDDDTAQLTVPWWMRTWSNPRNGHASSQTSELSKLLVSTKSRHSTAPWHNAWKGFPHQAWPSLLLLAGEDRTWLQSLHEMAWKGVARLYLLSEFLLKAIKVQPLSPCVFWDPCSMSVICTRWEWSWVRHEWQELQNAQPQRQASNVEFWHANRLLRGCKR